MSIFSKWFGTQEKQEHTMVAFATGTMCYLSETPDEAFSSLSMGNGVAITPDRPSIVAPVDGEITMIFPTKHAFGLVTEDGIELLVHMGIDTVNLKGKGYKYFKEVNTKVRAGEKIVDVDIDVIEKSGCNPIVMMIVVNENGYDFTYEANGSVKKGKSVIGRYEIKETMQ
ncbi:PTS sugar transporter subunit IIA [Lacrimispora indolis]|uniref:PTS sugar transporter subunit IIA n=1 Tax=Lacrimispora indolis TaxID=69825 RepID=UPI0004A2EB11|nr:PTS glucose transporter subunit IIA [Lacrimispora indolis]